MAKPKVPKAKKPFSPQSVKGMHDILPQDYPYWEKIQRSFKEIAEYYNFLPISTPVVESLDLYARTTGETSDIVEKQMFLIKGKAGGELALRPEFTPGLARAYVEHGLSHMGNPLKLYTQGPLYRHEQPQAGRYREFHQIECDIISAENDPVYDAQVILVLARILESLKIKDVMISINSIGCRECRPKYRRELVQYYRARKSKLCADCVRRLETNPLRLLDCKEEGCVALKKGAPIMIDHLCKACHDHFKLTLEYLDELKLGYVLDHYLVRGLDYYTNTVFEMVPASGGGSLGGGGRYDYLIEDLGGKKTPAVGWAAGVERIVEYMRAQGIQLSARVKPKPFFIYIGDLAKKRSLTLIEELRRADVDVMESLGRESLNAQLRNADKFQSPIALIFGQKEAFEESIIIRDLKAGVQETVPLHRMIDAVKKKLRE